MEDNKAEVANIEDKIKKFQALDISSVNDKINMAEVKISELITKINSLGKSITSLETKRDFSKVTLSKIGTDKDSCPVCLKPVTAADKDHIKQKKLIHKEEINKYETEIHTLDEKLHVYEESKSKLVEAVSKLKDIVNKQNLQNQQKKHFTQKRSDLLSYNKDIIKDLEDLDKQNNDFLQSLNDQKQRLDLNTRELEGTQGTMNILDYVKFVLGEDGVRSYIVKKILTLFNNKLSYYLRKLNSNAFIKFDEFFEETIINNKDVPTSYFNYSGAEKKVIDLAIMFTFIEMLRLQSGVIYNIQFYDELLDTSLDEAGVELVVSLLNELTQANNYGIYVISHRKECSRLSTGDVIFLEKKDGITKRMPFEA